MLLVSICLFSVLTQAQNQPRALSQNQITASYLYNFAKNIEWPNENGLTSFRIAIYRSQNPAFIDELRLLEQRATLKGRPITITDTSNLKALANHQMIYVESPSEKNISDIYSVIDGKPVLLVTSGFTNQQVVMINLMAESNKRLRFEVNKSNILNQGLTPLPELILNGGSEIDVAQLYREGQASLITLQKQLASREQSLIELVKNISQQEAHNRKLEEQLRILNFSIEESATLITEQNKKLSAQRQQIANNNKEQEALRQEVKASNAELERQGQELQASTNKLNKIHIEIESREKRLADLNRTIVTQEEEINQQQNAITELDELVSSQKTALLYSRALAVLGLLLVITILVAYQIKRRDNLKLAAHSKDLQMARDRLVIAKRKAEDANQAKGEFLSLMSHELRTPLQAIIGYTDVVIEELRMEGQEDYIDDLSRVIRNSERLLKLINGVLDLAKIESGRMELNLTQIRLSALIEEAVENVQPQFEKNNNTLNVDTREELSGLVIDPEKLLHILINLLSNATKFTENGVVDIDTVQEKEHLRIDVKDNGIGMSEDQQQHIFDRFKQADSSTTRGFQGSGLGLSITRQFCQLMGGTITVESQLGHGSTFTVMIPLPVTPLEQFGGHIINEIDTQTLENAPFNAEGQHIVMIDDDPAFLDIMARAMKREGYHVHTAINAEMGLELIEKIKPEVITLDLLLPDQHGWLLYEKIKNNPELKHIPVIVISIVDDRKHRQKHHVDEYLTKPIGREALKLAVQRLLDAPQ